MDPRDLPADVQSRLVPGLVDSQNPGNAISLDRLSGYKKLGDLSIGANARGAKRFRTEYGRYVEPLVNAFERVHGITPQEAMTRRYEPDQSCARERLRLDLQKARAQGAKEAQHETQKLLTQRENLLTVYGNRMSVSRYSSQRLALYFEVCVPCHSHAQKWPSSHRNPGQNPPPPPVPPAVKVGASAARQQEEDVRTDLEEVLVGHASRL